MSLVVFLNFSFISLILVSGSEEKQSEKRFQFTGNIQEITVVGKGANHELGTRTIDKKTEINVIKKAMQNASEFFC